MQAESAERLGKELREEIEKCGPRSPSRRFPEELKARVGHWAAEQRKGGMGGKAVAEILGVPWETVSRWCGERAPAAPRRTKKGKLRPVTLLSSPAPLPAGGLILRTPQGFTLEGLDVASAAQLLGRLV